MMISAPASAAVVADRPNRLACMQRWRIVVGAAGADTSRVLCRAQARRTKTTHAVHAGQGTNHQMYYALMHISVYINVRSRDNLSLFLTILQSLCMF